MAITVVQSKVIPGALSGSFTTNTTAGNCVIVIVNAFNTTSGNVPSVSGVTIGGSAGNFTQAVSSVSPFTTFYALAAIWVDPNCAGGQTAIAVSGSNLTVNANYGIIILEVAGLATSNVVDKTSSSNAASGTSWTSGTTATTTQANEFWVGANNTGATATQPGSPWTNFGYSSSNEGGGYQIVSSTGTATYSGTQSGSSLWAACVATLMPPVTNITSTGTVTFNPAVAGTVKVANPVTSTGAVGYNLAVAGSITVADPITSTGAVGFNLAVNGAVTVANPITSTSAISFSLAVAGSEAETIPSNGAVTFSLGVAGTVKVANPVTSTGAVTLSLGVNGTATETLNNTGFGIIHQWDGTFWVPYQAGIAEGSSSVFPNTIGLNELDVGLVYAGIVDATTITAATFVGTDWLENSAGGFYYSSTPATGNLTASIAPSAGTDSHSNAYKAGVYAYGPSGSYIGLANDGSFASLLMLPPGPPTHQTANPAVLSKALNAGAANEQIFTVVTSGKESGNVDAAVQVFSASADNTLNATITFEFGGSIYSTITQSAFTLFGVPMIIKNQTIPNVQFIPSTASSIGTNPQIQVQALNGGASNEQILAVFTSGKEGVNADAALQLFSTSADATASATAKLEFGGAVGLTVTSGGISAPNFSGSYSGGHSAAGWPIASGATIGTVSGSNVIIASGFLGALNNLRNAAVASGAIV